MSSRKKEKTISELFDRHYSRLYNYAFKIVCDDEAAKELVQEVFIKLWENIDHIDQVERSISSYLIVTLKNKIIDQYRKGQTRKKHINHFTEEQNFQTHIDAEWDLNERISSVYSSLPERTSEIFSLSRTTGLTYIEISQRMNVSLKTVEFHVSKALKAFREGLKDYL